MRKLEGKVCVITGGAGSIGLATARLFLARGARVMLVDVADDALRQAVESLGGECVAGVAGDVSQEPDVRRFIEATVAKWGAIDVLFSNAGNTGVVAPLADYPQDEFDRLMAVHVRGAFLVCKHGLPAMREGGSVVITSSVAALRGDAGIYGVAKLAQVGLMRVAAREAARRRIRVNTVHPGPVDNGFQGRIEAQLSAVLQRNAGEYLDGLIPLQRHARPEEIANAVLYLASAQSSFVTGSTMMVDGGLSA